MRRTYIEHLKQWKEHKRAIYPHGFLGCICGAAKGDKCKNLQTGIETKHPHYGRRIAPGFGLRDWLNNEQTAAPRGNGG